MVDGVRLFGCMGLTFRFPLYPLQGPGWRDGADDCLPARIDVDVLNHDALFPTATKLGQRLDLGRERALELDRLVAAHSKPSTFRPGTSAPRSSSEKRMGGGHLRGEHRLDLILRFTASTAARAALVRPSSADHLAGKGDVHRLSIELRMRTRRTSYRKRPEAGRAIRRRREWGRPTAGSPSIFSVLTATRRGRSDANIGPIDRFRSTALGSGFSGLEIGTASFFSGRFGRAGFAALVSVFMLLSPAKADRVRLNVHTGTAGGAW